MEKKKVLFVANHKGFSKFNAPYMKWFKSQGWQVDNASPGIETGEVDNQYDIDIDRSPLSLKNIKAIFQLKKIIDKNNYDIIHVHTPMGGVVGRLAARTARKKGTKIIYTAHGFHFFNGAPIPNWLIFYPIERLLAPLTDVLVTINQEDYERACNLQMAKQAIYHIDGVGVNLDRFKAYDEKERLKIRESLGLDSTHFVALYTAQFIARKNHSFLLRYLPEIVKKIPNFRLVLAGNGPCWEDCKELAKKYEVEKYVLFLGGRSDIPDLCGMADIHIASSHQEGQGINNIEAMAAGCPLVVSDVRGHQDVCIEGRNGFRFKLDDPNKFIDSIYQLYHNKDLFNTISQNNLKDVEKYDVRNSVNKMGDIYLKTMDTKR